jgi:hypothetical protein
MVLISVPPHRQPFMPPKRKTPGAVVAAVLPSQAVVPAPVDVVAGPAIEASPHLRGKGIHMAWLTALRSREQAKAVALLHGGTMVPKIPKVAELGNLSIIIASESNMSK